MTSLFGRRSNLVRLRKSVTSAFDRCECDVRGRPSRWWSTDDKGEPFVFERGLEFWRVH
jgi:hypothetical protein